MSRLNDLIQELCPDGVEFKSLEEVCVIHNNKRRAVTASDRIKGNVPYYGANNIQDYVEGYTHDGEYILIAEDGSTSLDNYSVQFVTGKFWANNHVHVICTKEFLLNKFVYYYLKTVDFKTFLTGGQRAKLTRGQLVNIVIPIPPLEVQGEIVRVLDTFTELTAELTAELTSRKKQYEYYRDSLFNLENVNCIPMGNESIGQFIRGSGLQKRDFTDEGVGCIHYGQIYTHYGTYTNKTKSFVSEEFAKKARKAQYGNLVIATTSENDADVCKAVAWLGDEEIAISSDACYYTHNLNPKYVSYFFQTEQFQSQKRGYITGAKVRRVNANSLAKIKIPIPTLIEQQRIVDILDRFDTLCNDISKGLPAEIEMRKKQYEHYRDKILVFKNIESEV